jgi:hypothetical protein
MVLPGHVPCTGGVYRDYVILQTAAHDAGCVFWTAACGGQLILSPRRPGVELLHGSFAGSRGIVSNDSHRSRRGAVLNAQGAANGHGQLLCESTVGLEARGQRGPKHVSASRVGHGVRHHQLNNVRTFRMAKQVELHAFNRVLNEFDAGFVLHSWEECEVSEEWFLDERLSNPQSYPACVAFVATRAVIRRQPLSRAVYFGLERMAVNIWRCSISKRWNFYVDHLLEFAAVQRMSHLVFAVERCAALTKHRPMPDYVVIYCANRRWDAGLRCAWVTACVV